MNNLTQGVLIRDLKRVCDKLSKKHVLRSIGRLDYVPKGTVQKNRETLEEYQPVEHDVLILLSIGENKTGKYVQIPFDKEEYLKKNFSMKKIMDKVTPLLREAWEKDCQKWVRVK